MSEPRDLHFLSTLAGLPRLGRARRRSAPAVPVIFGHQVELISATEDQEKIAEQCTPYRSSVHLSI